MAEFTPEDKWIVDHAREFIEAVRPLGKANRYKAEAILCQIWSWENREINKQLGRRLKWLAKKGYLPLTPLPPDQDGKTLYLIVHY